MQGDVQEEQDDATAQDSAPTPSVAAPVSVPAASPVAAPVASPLPVVDIDVAGDSDSDIQTMPAQDEMNSDGSTVQATGAVEDTMLPEESPMMTDDEVPESPEVAASSDAQGGDVCPVCKSDDDCSLGHACDRARSQCIRTLSSGASCNGSENACEQCAKGLRCKTKKYCFKFSSGVGIACTNSIPPRCRISEKCKVEKDLRTRR